MVNFTTILCTIVLCLSFNYGSTVVNFRLPKTQNCNSNPKRDPVMAARLNLIKSMTLEVWKQNNRLPDDYYYEKSEKGYTVVQMLSSLWVMGLKGEFELSKKWLEASFDGIDHMEFTFLASTEYLGSMLSCFALTNDTTWLNKAKKAGQRLKLEFDTPTGLPNRFVKSKRRLSFQNDIHLAEAGGEHLELTYLADMTNDLDMKTKIRTARTFLQYVKKPNKGLYGDYIDVNTGEWTTGSTDTDYRLFFHSNTFYPYLVKSFVQSNGQDRQAIKMYREAISAMVKYQVIQTFKNHLTYVIRVDPENIINSYMDYNSCNFGAMLALGADVIQRKLYCNSSNITNLIRQHWTLAKAVTETCHLWANRTETKLPSDDGKKSAFWTTAAYAESYFVLWRLTHDVKYRDYAWELTRAIYNRSRCVDGKYHHHPDVHDGYCNFLNNDSDNKPKLHHLSTTLKYLYLTFTEDSVLPLDQWVFNRVGQPLPVCGNNGAYPADKCIKCL